MKEMSNRIPVPKMPDGVWQIFEIKNPDTVWKIDYEYAIIHLSHLCCYIKDYL